MKDSIITEFNMYREGSGLMGLTPNLEQKYRTVDNGVLFLSQTYHVLRDLGLDTEAECEVPMLMWCLGKQGYLHRDPQDKSYDMPDDYYGYLSVMLRAEINCSCLKIVPPYGASKVTIKGIYGYVKDTIQMWQPGLHYMRGLTNDKLLWRLYSPIMALTLATSNLLDKPDHVSDRMLTWTIIKGLQSRSFLCKIGGKIWVWRMKRQYGAIKRIAEIYFGEQHPIAKYMKE